MVQAVIILAFHHSLSCLCVSNGILQEEEYHSFFKLPTNRIIENICANSDIGTTKKQTKEQEKQVLDYLKNYSSDNEKEENKDSDQEHRPSKHKQEIKPHEPSQKKKKKLSGNDSSLESGIETSSEITKNNEFSQYFEKFLFVDKNTPKIKFVNFEWHEYKGLKSYVLDFFIK